MAQIFRKKESSHIYIPRRNVSFASNSIDLKFDIFLPACVVPYTQSSKKHLNSLVRDEKTQNREHKMKMKMEVERKNVKIVFTIETAMSPLSKRMSQCYKTTICAYGMCIERSLYFQAHYSSVISSRTVHSSIIKNNKKDFLRFPPSILFFVNFIQFSKIRDASRQAK